MHINMNKGSGIIEFTTREGKLKKKKETFKLFIKGIKRKIYRKSKSRATDVV